MEGTHSTRRRPAPHAVAVGLLLGLSLVLAACEPSEGEAADSGLDTDALDRCSVFETGDLYLGTAIAYTGALSDYAEVIRRAVELAAFEINEAGGVHGQTLGILNCDTRNDPIVARQVIAELGAQPLVAGIIGPITSENVVSVNEAVVAAKVPAVSPSATSPSVAQLEDEGFIFSTTVTDSHQGVVLAHIALLEEAGRVLVVHRDDAWGRGLAGVFAASYEALGGEAQLHAYDTSLVEVEDVVGVLASSGAQTVLPVAYLDDGAAIIKAIANAGYEPDWLLTDGCSDEVLLQKIGDPAILEGAVGVTPTAPRGPAYEAFQAAYLGLIGEEPGAFTANAYDAVYLLAIAMLLAEDALEGQEVRDALATATSAGEAIGPGEWAKVLADEAATSFDYQGASGPVDFNDAGEVLSDIREWRVQDGRFVVTGCYAPDARACQDP